MCLLLPGLCGLPRITKSLLERLIMPIKPQEQMSQREKCVSSSPPKALHSWGKSWGKSGGQTPKKQPFVHSGATCPHAQWEMCFQDRKEKHPRSPSPRALNPSTWSVSCRACWEAFGWRHEEYRARAHRSKRKGGRHFPSHN